jgi:hypothetical protein
MLDVVLVEALTSILLLVVALIVALMLDVVCVEALISILLLVVTLIIA